MNSYTFEQYCRPRRDLRVDETLDFLILMKEAFRFPRLYDRTDLPIELGVSVLRAIFQKEINKRSPGIGSDVDFFSIPPRKRDDNTVRFEIHTGTGPEQIFIDTYHISIGAANKVPDFDYFEKSIEIFKPFEAYISEFRNESLMNAYDRQQAIPKFDRPAIIRGWHYLDEGMARSIGGIQCCLKAPAWHVERFCEGVLIQLVPGLFDSDDSEHLAVQEEVMEYFHII
jgi:hypothetical protein